MKFLLFSDLHGNRSAAQNLAGLAQSVDIVIGAGDFGNLRRGIDTAVALLNRIDKPAVLVPGNSESAEELEAACRKLWPAAHVLHGSGITLEGVDFFGIGGGIPVTPFGSWSYDFTEDEARRLLADCPMGGVLISHSPPKGAVDVSSRGISLGSVAVREVIEQQQPALVVCGHIHESAGQQAQVGNSVVVNAGPQGIVWDLSL
ncbi:MAG: metallophosphoesterase family protein [Anaerolineae bacterium]|nr:metallophosphoesterase family protein [Anaerolineae bacterium]